MADDGDLATMVAKLSAEVHRIPPRALVGRLDAVGAAARAEGHRPAATIARLIALAVEAGAGRRVVAGWLPVLADAVASGRRDPAAAASYAAACQVVLAG